MKRNGYNYGSGRIKKKSSAPAVFFLLLTISVFAVGCVWLSLMPKPNTTNSIPAATKPAQTSSEEAINPTPDKGSTTARIVSVGDNLIHSGVYLQAKKRGTNGGYDFEFTYQNVASRIAAADIATVNHETPMAPGFEISGYPMFNAPTEVGEELNKIGFDVINIANNHILDVGTNGLIKTVDYLKTLKSQYVGVFNNKADYDTVRTMTANDIVFGFVGATEMTNGLSLAKNSEAIISSLKNEARIKEQITRAKAVSDVVVANVHWGVEYTHDPNDFQKEMAKKLASWGADIIIGHHPHVIQPVEYINREDGSRAVVVYSLGNFVSTQEFGPRMLGGMLDVTVKKELDTEKTTIQDVKFVPIVTHYERSYGNVRNYFLEDYTKELADAHGCHERSQHFGMDYLYNTVRDVVDSEFLEDFIKKAE